MWHRSQIVAHVDDSRHYYYDKKKRAKAAAAAAAGPEEEEEASLRIVRHGLRVLVASAHARGSELRLELREGELVHYPLVVDLTAYGEDSVCDLLQSAKVAELSGPDGLLCLRVPGPSELERSSFCSEDLDEAFEVQALARLRRVLRLAVDEKIRLAWRKVFRRLLWKLGLVKRLVDGRTRARRARQYLLKDHHHHHHHHSFATRMTKAAAPPTTLSSLPEEKEEEVPSSEFELKLKSVLAASKRVRADLDVIAGVILRAKPLSVGDVFRALPRAARDELLAAATQRRVPAGATIARAGDPIDHACLVLGGAAAFFAPVDGAETRVGQALVGDSFGDQPFFKLLLLSRINYDDDDDDATDSPVWDHSVAALQPTWLLRLPRSVAAAIAQRRRVKEKAALEAALSRLGIKKEAKLVASSLYAVAHRRTFKVGDLLLAQDAPPRDVVAIVTGECRIVRAVLLDNQRKKKRNCRLQVEIAPRLSPGDMVGANTDGRLPFSVLATTLVEVLSIPVATLRQRDETACLRVSGAVAQSVRDRVRDDDAALLDRLRASSRWDKEKRGIVADVLKRRHKQTNKQINK